ncbi:UNVERIFIED_ORG: transposase [Rhizobium sophorae]|uniref:hypothetical protein n=1 Tax=Rhizobium leguminosarum TaxID=384 RepID=UPI001620522D|nr:hypothetical protein [Rhizobium leguminosarum]MBB4520456.1 transposase [Rhizobium leguminosarum]MDH6658337.1 transposase [Rhizobium sophorae]
MRPAADCTLDDIPEWVAIFGACPACERGEQIYKSRLVRRFGKGALLVQIEKKLRCTKCGGCGANRFALKKIPRD